MNPKSAESFTIWFLIFDWTMAVSTVVEVAELA
jgi:hypothetical protein